MTPPSMRFASPCCCRPAKKRAFTLAGFRSANGCTGQANQLQYQVSEEELAKADQEKIEAGAKEPRLLDLLETMKQKRSNSLRSPNASRTSSSGQKDGLFVGLQSQVRDLQMAETRSVLWRCLGDHVMCSDFRIGSDGQSWWWHIESARSNKFVVCPAKEMHELDISICDPFDLTARDARRRGG